MVTATTKAVKTTIKLKQRKADAISSIVEGWKNHPDTFSNQSLTLLSEECHH